MNFHLSGDLECGSVLTQREVSVNARPEVL